MQKQWDAIWVNGLIATCEQGYSLIEEAALATKDQRIVWVGAERDLPDKAARLANEVHDLAGRCMTPGLIDCHTHLVYAGNRSHEFELRLHGVSYEKIAKNGGGIQSTVRATRAISEAELLKQSLTRARALLMSGVTTLEIKSGYGLDSETECKILRVAEQLEKILPLTIKKTFLGAHTVPDEYLGNADHYIDYVCREMIPAVAKQQLADAVDVFCEKIAFNLAQTEQVFKTAKQYGLSIKCHAEQLSDSASTLLAAKYRALSVDHLEYASKEGIEAISHSGTVAVLLPGAFYFLRESQLPPIQYLRDYQVPIAIASDCNPGTSPVLSLLLILNMACTLFRLTPEEALQGVTSHAASALGLGKTHGSLTVGKMADMAIWDVSHPVELAYYLGFNPLYQLVKSGEIIFLA